MNEQLIYTIYQKITEYQTIIIHRHRSPDLDAVGAQTALKNLLKLNFPDKQVYAVGTDKAEEFSFIATTDELDQHYYQDALVIIVDTANRARIDDLNYQLGKEIIKIDHHPDIASERYGVLNLIDDNCCSTAELIYHFYQVINQKYTNFTIDATIAHAIFCGIYGDTGGFSYPNTSSTTFSILAKLTTHDFDYEATILNLKVYDYEVIKIIGFAYQNITILPNGVGFIAFDQALQKQLNISAKKLSTVVNFFGIIKQLKVWVVFNEHDNFIRVNLRSREQYDISKIAVKFEGGGHKNASGAMIYSWSDQAKIIEMLAEMVE